VSISVGTPKRDLILEAYRLGIYNSIVGLNDENKVPKENFIVAIRQANLSKKYGNNIPTYLSLLQEIKSPMLSKRIDELKKDLQDEIWSSSEWEFEAKINGIRCLLIKDGNGINIFSRFNDKFTLMPIQFPIYLPNIQIENIKETFILDCELVSDNSETSMYLNNHGILTHSNTEGIDILLSSMHPKMSITMQKDFDFRFVFNVIDCIYYEGWVVNEPLQKRRDIIREVIDLLKDSNISLKTIPYTDSNKNDFYTECLYNGYEGCIAKRKESVYVPDTTRNRKGWIKIKGVQKDTIGVDTVEAFITGFTMGDNFHVSSNSVMDIDLSVWVKDEDENKYVVKSLGKVRRMNSIVRNNLSFISDGIPTINPECFNSVVELNPSCTEVIRQRFDKGPRDCILDRDIYNKIVSLK